MSDFDAFSREHLTMLAEAWCEQVTAATDWLIDKGFVLDDNPLGSVGQLIKVLDEQDFR